MFQELISLINISSRVLTSYVMTNDYFELNIYLKLKYSFQLFENTVFQPSIATVFRYYSEPFYFAKDETLKTNIKFTLKKVYTGYK